MESREPLCHPGRGTYPTRTYRMFWRIYEGLGGDRKRSRGLQWIVKSVNESTCLTQAVNESLTDFASGHLGHGPFHRDVVLRIDRNIQRAPLGFHPNGAFD